MRWPGSLRRSRRIHRCRLQRVGDEGVVSNGHGTDLLPCIGDSAQVVEGIRVCRDGLLCTVEVIDLDCRLRDDRDVFLLLIPQDRVEERIAESCVADLGQRPAAVSFTQPLCD